MVLEVELAGIGEGAASCALLTVWGGPDKIVIRICG